MPTREEIRAGVLKVLGAHARPGHPVTPKSRLVADLGLDSMQVIEIVGELEERFDLSIPLDDPSALQTVEQVVDGIERLLREARP